MRRIVAAGTDTAGGNGERVTRAQLADSTPVVSPCRHTAVMALRFTVQGDTEAETAEGLRMLLSLGLQRRLNPTDMISNGWMARAVLAPTAEPPADSDQGPDAATTRRS